MDKLGMPKEENGFVVTLNKQGYMTSTVDYYMNKFIEYSAVCSKPMVDVGAAYGVASIPALKKGAKVVAIDLDERHLEIIRERTPKEYKDNLITKTGEFPIEFDFEENSIGAFLVARVLHFFTPDKLVATAEKLFKWLDRGGKLFLTAETPYLSNIESFIPVYEERLKQKKEFAGFIEDFMKYAPERGAFLPEKMLLLDPPTLETVFTNAGFIIEKLDFLPRPEFPDDLRRDNKESVGLICRKPE